MASLIMCLIQMYEDLGISYQKELLNKIFFSPKFVIFLKLQELVNKFWLTPLQVKYFQFLKNKERCKQV